MSARRLIGAAVCVMVVGIALVQANTALAQTTTTLPTTGPAVASFAAFESQFQSYMQRNSFTGANVAVSVRSAAGNVVIYERGFGFADRARTVLMTPRAPMRIASVSKAFTRAALQTLERQGKLRFDDRVFCVPGLVQANQKCWLRVEPISGAAIDPRLGDITLLHLFAHQGGWRGELSGDWAVQPERVQRALAITDLPTPQDVAKVVVSRPLDAAPGSVASYSNTGYLLLGLVIEAASGEPYKHFTYRSVLLPTDASVAYTARSLPQDRNPAEPEYISTSQAQSYFDNRTVPTADGGIHFEHAAAYAGWVASPRSVVNFADAFRVADGSPRGSEDVTQAVCGSGPGTSSLAANLPGRISVAVHVNQRRDSTSDCFDLFDLVQKTINSGALNAAPAARTSPPEVAGLWWNPDESGHGIAIAQGTSAADLFITWYYYDSSGAARWLVASNGRWNAAKDTFSAALYAPTSANYLRYDASLFKAGQPVGTVDLQFISGGFLKVTGQIGSTAINKSLLRWQFGRADAKSALPQVDLTGLWWGGASQNGWGLSLNTQGRTSFAAWYTYDAQGAPQWFVMSDLTPITPVVAGVGDRTPSLVYEGTLYRTSGKPTFTSGDAQPTQARAVGKATMTIQSNRAITATLVVDGNEINLKLERFDVQ